MNPAVTFGNQDDRPYPLHEFGCGILTAGMDCFQVNLEITEKRMIDLLQVDVGYTVFVIHSCYASK
jgi:hypothetical protein